MKKKDSIKIIKIMLLIIALILIIGIIIYLAPLVKDISTTEGRIKFKEKIDSLGIYGILVLAGLQLAQIFLIILPRRAIRSFSRNVLWFNWWNNFYLCNSFYNNNNNILSSKKIWKKICI